MPLRWHRTFLELGEGYTFWTNRKNTQKQSCRQRRNRHRRRPCVAGKHPTNNRTPQATECHQTWQREQSVAFTRDSSCENTLPRDDHAPSTDEHSSCSKQRLDQRTAASKVGGRVSTRGRWNTTDLAAKIVKNWSTAKTFQRATQARGELFPFGTSLECFPTNKQRKTKRHKPPPNIVRGD
jgi:hypothetical protein